MGVRCRLESRRDWAESVVDGAMLIVSPLLMLIVVEDVDDAARVSGRMPKRMVRMVLESFIFELEEYLMK